MPQDQKKQRQHGLWPSPLSPKAMAAGRRFGDAQWDDDGETLVWVEGRSDRSLLVAQSLATGEAARDLTPDVDVRGKVGYGGGDFTVARGHAFFAHAGNGRLYRLGLTPGATPKPLTPPFGACAAPRVSPDGRWVAYVHADDERNDRLAIVDAEGKLWPQILASGHDFYQQVRWSPDGLLVAFVAWDHPNMPWDGCTLYVAAVNHPNQNATTLPTLGTPKKVAGGPQTSVFQPEFTPDGKTLVYVSDESGFQQLHAHDLTTGRSRQVTRLEGVELGMAAWVQDMRSYALTPDGRSAYACVNKRGFVRVYKVELASGEAELVDALSGYTDVGQPAVARKSGRLALLASASQIPPRLVTLDPGGEKAHVVARASGETLADEDLSAPVALTWKTAGLEEAHGLYYPPASRVWTSAGRPPLLVLIHGGPTSQARAGWAPSVQFFATRGWAVLQVNHRGSTGYGREYMLKLRGKWGQLDVEDAVSGARHLVETGKADPERTVIMGGSAGGYTVLQTMVDDPEAFAAGVSMYGIANQFTLVQDTHKFEERYTDSLIGALPEAAKLYRARSPLFHAHKIKRPLAVFQGEKDKVVPKDQAEQIVAALRRNGTPHVYHLYAGEGHGWRKTETVEHFYDAVDRFLREHVIYK